MKTLYIPTSYLCISKHTQASLKFNGVMYTKMFSCVMMHKQRHVACIFKDDMGEIITTSSLLYSMELYTMGRAINTIHKTQLFR